MLDSIKHVANGEEYEIRVVSTETGVTISSYRHGKQIGLTRTVSYEVAHQYDMNPARLTEFGAIATLINASKDDLNLLTLGHF